MKNYLIFMGDNYYPSGGMEDFIGSSHTIIDCFDIMNNELLKDRDEEYSFNTKEEWLKDEWANKWAHIYDLYEKVIIWDNFVRYGDVHFDGSKESIANALSKIYNK